MKKIFSAIVLLFLAVNIAVAGPIGSSGSGGSSISGLTTGNLPVAASSSTLGDSGIAATKGTANNLTVTGGSTGNPVIIGTSGGSNIGTTYQTSGKGIISSSFLHPTYNYTTELWEGLRTEYTWAAPVGDGYVAGLRSVLNANFTSDEAGYSEGNAIWGDARTDANNTHTITNLNGVFATVSHRGTGDITSAMAAISANAANYSAMSSDIFGASYSASTSANAPSITGMASQVNLSGGAVVPLVYGNYINAYNSGLGSTVTTTYGIWIGNGFETVGDTNNYAFWFDSTGVFRIKGDGVMAYYNPAFTKYTPGAANYERIVQQWNSNVAEIGTEAGGTGTQRNLRLLAAAVEIPSLTASRIAATDASKNLVSTITSANLKNSISDTQMTTTGAAGGKKVLCIDTATAIIYASSTGTDCSN